MRKECLRFYVFLATVFATFGFPILNIVFLYLLIFENLIFIYLIYILRSQNIIFLI